jgi:Zn-dependent peptidase ImmA (M78 family)/transcriptional regulator with XRE-family HTH domain
MGNSGRTVNPAMMILAREARGMSQSELAHSLGVTQGYISKMEMMQLPIPDDILEKLCKVLHYPRSFFLQDRERIGVGINEVFHRKSSAVPKRLIDQVHAHFDIRIQHLEALLHAVEIEVTLPQLDIDQYLDPEKIAQLTRAYLHIPRGPIKNLIKTAEDAGVIIIIFDFETPKIDGTSRWIPGIPVVFLNAQVPADRQRFTLAHELGHLIMHKVPDSNMEQQAHAFAAEFLMPARDIQGDFMEKVTLARLGILKQYWRVSMGALLEHASHLQGVTPNQYRYLRQQMAAAGYTTREPAEFDIPGETPTLLQEMITTHQTALSYTPSQLAEILKAEVDDVERQYLHVNTLSPRLRIVQ